ncbi:putative manganese transporter [bacterium]|nr:putative manganese transporter [bacterium]MBU2461925.1 putative manganese transporter [bacterium]
MEILTHALKHSLVITTLVFIMMVLVDYIEVLTQGRMSKIIKGGLWRQYLASSFLGATPGCLGSFACVSFYAHGLITFGAICGTMVATCGDEAFIMLALFPKQALILFGILFLLGLISAFVADKIAPILKLKPLQSCALLSPHPKEECRILDAKDVIEHLRRITLVRFLFLAIISIFIIALMGKIIVLEEAWEKNSFFSLLLLAIFIVLTVPDHYLEEHIFCHIIKRHIFKVFLWTFSALLIVDVGLKVWEIESFVKANILWVLLIAALVGMIPESGPHLIFVVMYAKGFIPFSVLLVSSIAQDGHGMLPLLSLSIKHSLLIKIFKLALSLILGIILYSLGL